MADKPSNYAVLEQLKNGIAQFELVSSPVPLISTSISQENPTALFGDYSHRFFAKTKSPSSFLGFSFHKGIFKKLNIKNSGSSAKMKVETVEYYKVQEVAGDGRCSFRALVQGMEANNGSPPLILKYESARAEELQKLVHDIICPDNYKKVQPEYEAALQAINDSESLKNYCERIQTTDFLGGKWELLVLSIRLNQPIVVYEHEHTNGGSGSGFTPIDKYGIEKESMKVVRLLKRDSNHYDLLVSETKKE